MALHLTVAPASALPKDTTHGFKIIDDDGVTVMFFHWHEKGQIELPPITHFDQDGNAYEQTPDPQPVTSYADVIAALPSRLIEMGYRDEMHGIIEEVGNMYGIG